MEVHGRTRALQPPATFDADVREYARALPAGRHVGALLLSLALLACGEEGQPRPLDRDKRLAQLTFQESLEVCHELNKLTVGDEEYVEQACSSYGLLISADDPSMSCIDAREECRAELASGSACWLDLKAKADGEPESCPMTRVGEMLDCMASLVANTKQRYANVSCSDPSSNPPLEMATDAWQNIRDNPPEGCRPLLTSCPEFFEVDDEM